MNMTREKYPDPAAYIRWWKAIKELADDAPANHPRLIRAAYANLPTDALSLKRNFMTALHSRINERGKLAMQGRCWDEAYQTDLFRDQQDLHYKVSLRVRIHQFRTDIVRQRFGYLQEMPVKPKPHLRWRTRRPIRLRAHRRLANDTWREDTGYLVVRSLAYRRWVRREKLR